MLQFGFKNLEEIRKYLGTQEEKQIEYDIALIDVDSTENYYNFNIKSSYKNYFVTSFDIYSLKKGLEIINNIEEKLKLTKILFSKDMIKEDNEYLNYLSLGSKVIWNEEFRVYIPIDNGDLSIIIENQRVSKIGIRKLSQQYRDGIYYIVEDIVNNDVPLQKIKKTFKVLEKEV